MSSSYEKVRGGKLSFKGGLGPEKTLDKKKKKKHKKATKDGDGDDVAVDLKGGSDQDGSEKFSNQGRDEIDTGTGHAPDGKKSKNYEELFPVETKRFGYVIPKAPSREAALDERVKKKADRYCK